MNRDKYKQELINKIASYLGNCIWSNYWHFSNIAEVIVKMVEDYQEEMYFLQQEADRETHATESY